MSDTILVTKHTGYHIIALNRPEKMNAFNVEMHVALRKALNDARYDLSVRSVILTGMGKGFCAGQDLSDRVMNDDGTPPDLSNTLEENYLPLVKLIKSLPFPVIVAINGVAAGAGCNVALSCDIILSSDKARFIQAFAKLGLVPDAGGTYYLPRLIGEAKARYLALTAEAIDAETAEKWGLVAKVFPHDELMNEAVKMAENFAKAPTHGLALIKNIMNVSYSNTLNEQMSEEARVQKLAGSHPDYMEGVQAFMQKRSANFRGRI